MTTEKVIFGQSMEGLYRALEPLTAQEQAAFRKAGVNKDRFDAAYPLMAYIELLDACAASRFSHLSELDRFSEVGRLFFSGFEKTLVGSAMAAMLKVIGPRRTLERMTRNFRTANNFTEGVLEPLAPNHYRVRINYTLRPGFYLGLVEAGCLRAGAKGLVVQLVETKDFAACYDVKWA